MPPIERCEPNQISTCVVNNKISSFTKFCVLNIQLEITQNFYNTHTEAHRHFPKIIKSCPGHFKMCKFIKNLKSKILTKLILFFINIEESKNNSRIQSIFRVEVKDQREADNSSKCNVCNIKFKYVYNHNTIYSRIHGLATDLHSSVRKLK